VNHHVEGEPHDPVEQKFRHSGLKDDARKDGKATVGSEYEIAPGQWSTETKSFPRRLATVAINNAGTYGSGRMRRTSPADTTIVAAMKMIEMNMAIGSGGVIFFVLLYAAGRAV